MDKVRSVLASLVTYLVLAAVVLTIISEEIGNLFADGSAATFIGWLVKAIAYIGTVVNIIRRVTPVLPEQRGLVLPPGARQDVIIRSR